MACKGKCRRLPNARFGNGNIWTEYLKGYKRCRECEYCIITKQLRCCCCGWMFRTVPVSSRDNALLRQRRNGRVQLQIPL